MSGTRHLVRMAQRAVSAVEADVLLALGLGSCIGLALVDARGGVAGLAHVVLPQAPADGLPAPWKYADAAVPALVDAVLAAGARRGRLQAVLCGGAHMFGGAGGPSVLEIGSRNAAATAAALERVRVPVRASDTGGSHGRSLEVHVGSGAILVRGVGRPQRSL